MAMIGTNLRQNSELTGAKWQELEEIGYVRHALWCFPRTPPEKSYSVRILFFFIFKCQCQLFALS